jgi:hypothetical protein
MGDSFPGARLHQSCLERNAALSRRRCWQVAGAQSDRSEARIGRVGRSFPTSTREKRSNKTHASKIGPAARLCKKADGEESKLVFLGHFLMENRNGLVVEAEAAHARR